MPGQITLETPEPKVEARPSTGGAWIKLGLISAVLAAAFIKPLSAWAAYCWNSELYSHCVLIPAVSAYFVWMQRQKILPPKRAFDPLALIPASLGFLVLGFYWRADHHNWSPEDALAAVGAGFLLLLLAAVLGVLGRTFVKLNAFALFFLIFALPWPVSLQDAATAFLQHGSADLSEALLRLSGMTLFRQGTFFALPGFKMEVAPECSGIHSTLALFISSLAAGYLLLPGWKSRAFLAFAVLPLALLRNALRIFTIAALCVYVSPDMIHSLIHRRGGPVFFAFSLLPLFLLLLYLRGNRVSSHPKTNQNP